MGPSTCTAVGSFGKEDIVISSGEEDQTPPPQEQRPPQQLRLLSEATLTVGEFTCQTEIMTEPPSLLRYHGKWEPASPLQQKNSSILPRSNPTTVSTRDNTFKKGSRVQKKRFPQSGSFNIGFNAHTSWKIHTASKVVDGCNDHLMEKVLVRSESKITFRGLQLGTKKITYTSADKLERIGFVKVLQKRMKGWGARDEGGRGLEPCDSPGCVHTGLITPPATLRGANSCAYGPVCNPHVPAPDSENLIVVPGWKNRQVLGAYIEHVQSVVARENKPVGAPIFVTREQLEYEVMIDHGAIRTRIHGPGWQRFLDEYAVRPGDMVYICLTRGDGRFFVEVEMGGIRQTPLPYIALNGLSLVHRELVDQCVYTRGIRLEFPEMRKMIRRAFTPLEDICCIFVHKMTGVDIRGGYMRLPKKAVDLIESKTGHMDNSGSILLHDDTGALVAASFKKANDGRLVIQGGFPKCVGQLELKENDLVVITFHRRGMDYLYIDIDAMLNLGAAHICLLFCVLRHGSDL
ncbi:hypothetical protein CFC21_098461 [Triticum aestivum]|uniref:TF-B3 domain-containing protein n=2 Tax=Triticum aestivum TaxID=4565 RepID=A0A9R1LWU4_WHEAT|nr:hypothetical protein CFC21_098461 [Triticum aestivum]